MNPQKESLHQIKMRRVNRWRAAGFISVILLLLCLYPFLSDIQMQLHSSPPVKSYSTNLDTGQSQWATMYNEKRAERARLESGWATPKQKKLAYESLTSILKKESCLIFTVSFLEEMPATPKEIELARVANDSVEFHLPGHLVAAAATSPMTVFSKAFEDMKIAAATIILAEQNRINAQPSEMPIGPIESGFPWADTSEEDRLAKVNGVPDEQATVPEKIEKSTAKKFVVPRTFVKSVPEPTKTKAPKASTGGFSIATFSFVPAAAAATIYDEIGGVIGGIKKAVEKELATLASSQIPITQEGEEKTDVSEQIASISERFDPFSSPPASFANLGKKEAAKHVKKLIEINGIKNPKRLMAETTIKIPIDPTKKGSPTLNYKIKKGDCLWSIAMQSWDSGNHHSPHQKTKMAKAKTKGENTGGTP